MKINIFLLIVFAFILRIYFAFFYPQFPVQADARDYDYLGQNIAMGKGFVNESGQDEITRGPGYPFFLAAVYKIFGHSYQVVRFFQVAFSMITLVLIFLLTKEFFGQKAALISLVLASFYPPFLSYNGILYSESIFSFLVILDSWLFFYATRGRKWFAFIAFGLISGYTILLRAEFVLMFLVFCFLAAFNYRENFKKILFSVLIAFLVVMPWTLRNYMIFEKPVLVSSTLGSMLWISTYKGEWIEWHNDDPYYAGLVKGLNDYEKDRLLWKEGIKNIADDPLRYIKTCFKYQWRFWAGGHSNTFIGLHDSLSNYFKAGNYTKVLIKAGFLFFNAIVILLGFFGITEAFKKNHQKKKELALLVCPVVIVAALHFFLYGTARYQVPIMPLLIVFSSYGAYKVILSGEKDEIGFKAPIN